MRGTRWAQALLLASLGAAGCADLPVIQENSCGNGLVEPGEDCDGKLDASGADCSSATDTCVCRQAGEVDECRFRCDTAADCPGDGKGWGCGADHVCRRPRVCQGAVCDRWTSAAVVPESATQLTIADFDGSGRGGVLSVASPLVSVHSFDEAGRLLDSDVLVVPAASLAVGDLTSDDPTHPTETHPISDFAVDLSRGVEVFRGASDTGVQPTVYSSISLGATGRVQTYNFLDQSLHGPEILFFPVGPDGKTSSVLAFEAGNMPVQLAAIGGAGGKLAGDAVIAPFFNTLVPAFPCEQFAVSFEEAKGVKVYSPCKPSGALNIEGPDPTYVPPATILLPVGATIRKGVQGLFAVDADKDGTPDLLIVADDPIAGPGSLFLSFSRGDGSFHSTPDKLPPADNKAALYPVHTPLAQPEQVRKHLHDPPLAVGDINNDCAVDYVNSFGIYLSDIGKGSCFKPETFFTLSLLDEEHVWTSAVVDDFSADGLLDVIVGSSNVPGLTFYKGTGSSLLNPFKLVSTGGVKTFATGDFDGDFVRDLAFTQTGDVDEDGVLHESLAVIFGGITGGPSQPLVMGETNPVRQLCATNVLGIYPDFITDLLAISSDSTSKGLSLALFPGNSGRLLEAPYYLLNPKSALPDFPSQVAIGQFDDDPHNDIAAYGRQVCFTEAECLPQLWLVPVTGEAEIAPGGAPGAPVPTPLPLVGDGVHLDDIQAGTLLGAVDLGPAGGTPTDEVVLLTGGKPPLLYVATAVSGAWSIAPKQVLSQLEAGNLRQLGLAVADLDGAKGADVILSSRSGVLVLWNQGNGTLDTDHASFLSADDLASAACEGNAGVSAAVQAIGSVAADADAPRELVVSTGHATYLVEVQKGKLVPVCQQGLPGGIAVAGGDVNGDGVDDLAIGRKGGIELFLADPAPAGPDLTVRR